MKQKRKGSEGKGRETEKKVSRLCITIWEGKIEDEKKKKRTTTGEKVT